MYKKYPALRSVIKEQSGEAAQGLETAFKKKWQESNKIQSKGGNFEENIGRPARIYKK